MCCNWRRPTNPPKEWRRPRGRPRQTWLRIIENDLKHQNLGLWSARHIAYDRDLWRDIVETATLQQGHATWWWWWWWRRPPGRPRTTWMKTTQQDLESLNLSPKEAIDVAQNHPLWRMMSTFGATVHSWSITAPFYLTSVVTSIFIDIIVSKCLLIILELILYPWTMWCYKNDFAFVIIIPLNSWLCISLICMYLPSALEMHPAKTYPLKSRPIGNQIGSAVFTLM